MADSEAIWEKLKKGTFIIAEIGKNFIQTEEDQPVSVYLQNAMKLVDEAAKTGADAVKLQTHNVEDEILDIHVDSPHFPNWKKGRRVWVERNTRATPVREFWLPLKNYCEKRGIIFFSTPMSRGGAEILNEKVSVDFWKVGSGDILDFVMLDYIRQTGKPIILSSGMSTLDEVKSASEFLQEKNDRVALLHCVSKYPCPVEDLRLGTMELLKEQFNLPTGFSDHSIEVDPALVAVAMGATILEKHFTISRGLWGPDHKASLEPSELDSLVKEVRALENDGYRKFEILNSDFAKRSIGKREKIIQESEAIFRPLFRKSLMAGCDIAAGEIITADMVYAMRPQGYAGGLPSERYREVVGRYARRPLKKYDPITLDVLC